MRWKLFIRWFNMKVLRREPVRLKKIRHKDMGQGYGITHTEFWVRWWATEEDITSFRARVILGYAKERGFKIISPPMEGTPDED